MKLSDLASLAEIISAVAIVISLIFVGIEIRRNTDAEFLSSHDRLLADNVNWRMALATNRETVEAFETYREAADRESVDPAIWRMGNHTAHSAVLNFERAYFARFYGRLGDSEWGRYQRIMCDPNNDALHSKLNPRNFSQEFWDYLMQCLPE